MNALFLIPPSAYNRRGIPIDRVYGCNYGFDYKPAIHFLGVATLAVQRLGWQVRFLDCPAEGMDAAAFEASIASRDDEVVLFWTTYLSAVEDLRAAKEIARHRPDTRFVFMGAGATWRPEELLQFRRSYCLLGEPEGTLEELDRAWRGQRDISGTAGLAWSTPQGWSRGPYRELIDVPDLPMPDRSLLRGRYRANRLDHGPVTVMVASRGCGFKCTFCTTNAVDQAIDLEFKRHSGPVYSKRAPLRKRSAEQIIEEMRAIAAAGYKSVEIADNIFTWGRSRTIEICEGIEDLGLEWICLARANMLHDAEQIQAMARAGCKLVYMGSESFDDGLLEDVVKEIKVKDIEKAVRTCRENGLEPEVSVLIGASPRETWSTVWNSWRASRRLGTRFVHFCVALPSPSTQMYDDAMAQGWFVEGDFRPADNQREVIVNLPHLSQRELQLAIKLVYAAQYLSPSGVWKHASRIRNLDDLRHKASAAGKLLEFLAKGSEPEGPAVPPGRITPMTLP